MEDWMRVNREVPRLVDALPNGPRGFATVQVFLAGGVPELMLHLRRAGLLDTNAMTAAGVKLGEGLDWWEQSERRRKLKAEYQTLTGDQIRDLRLAGAEVTEERRIARVAYVGDSSPEGLDACPAMYEAQVLITELTFVAPRHRKDKIHKFGHMHLDDLIERRGRFRNELVVASHFSTRYHQQQVRHYVSQALPDMLDGRLHLWL